MAFKFAEFSSFKHEVVIAISYILVTRRMQNLGFFNRLLGPISDQVVINRASKGRELHQVIS